MKYTEELLGKAPENLSEEEFIKFLEQYPCGDLMFRFSRYVSSSMGEKGSIRGYYTPNFNKIEGHISSEEVVMSPKLKAKIEATGSRFND